MEELEQNPGWIEERTIELHELPEIFNYDVLSLNRENTEVRKVRNEYKYIVWQNKERHAVAWWDLQEQVNTHVISVMWLIVIG